MLNKTVVNDVNSWLSQYKSGWTLPKAMYLEANAGLVDFELFRKHWFFVATVAELKQEGDFLVFDIGNDSIILIRNAEGEIKGFYNVCCHRGSQVLLDKQGCCANLVCHYHQWTYNLDGQLIYAGSMGENFDQSKFRLQPVHVENIGGMIFVALGEEYPESIRKVKELLTPYLQPYRLDKLKVAHSDHTIRQADWKLIMENNRECYHCSSNHPELVNSIFAEGFGYDMQLSDEVQAIFELKNKEWEDLGLAYETLDYPDDLWVRAIRLPLTNQAVTQTSDGLAGCSKLLTPFSYPETSELSLWTYPNSWHHFLNDHVVNFSILPLDNKRSMVRTTWLVDEEAVEGEDYDLEHLTEVWLRTNEQDALLFENVMVGLQSEAYQQGPFSPDEKYVAHFVNWYCQSLKQLVK